MNLVQYSSNQQPKIYQTDPVYSKLSQFKPKGWTDSTLGYINEAKQWAMCILKNRQMMKRPYTWAVHINLNEELPPKDIGPMWDKAKRKLKERGIVCLWLREPNSLNKVHYHIIVKNHISEKELKKAIDEAMPSRKLVKWRKRVEPIINEWRLAHYVVKAKVKGRTKKGKLVNDLYRHKRLLFKPNLPFRKVGTIGDFWEQGKSKTKIWDDIKATEKRIAEGLEDPDVERLAEYVHDWIGGYYPLAQVRRSFGYWADTPAIRDWINSLIATDWTGEWRY